MRPEPVVNNNDASAMKMEDDTLEEKMPQVNDEPVRSQVPILFDQSLTEASSSRLFLIEASPSRKTPHNPNPL